MKRLLINVAPLIKALELTTRSALGGALMGNYRSKFKGKGVEFEEYVDYVPGDDSKLIDWKASMRSNKLLIKHYVEERNLKIFFLIDVSNSMVYTTGKKLKSEFVGELVLSLAYLMVKNFDHVGYGLFNDKIIDYMPPTSGLMQYYKLIDSLSDSSKYGGGYDLEFALKFLYDHLEPGGVLIIISDFIGLSGSGWQKLLKLNAQKSDIISIMVRDPVDLMIPKVKRSILLKDPFSSKQLRVKGAEVRENYNRLVRQQEKELEDFFIQSGADFLRLDSNRLFAGDIISFFKERRGKWR